MHELISVSNFSGDGYPPWGNSRPTGFHQPAMRPRSPRLVFRDPVEPGTIAAPSGFFGDGLQDIASEEDQGICYFFSFYCSLD